MVNLFLWFFFPDKSKLFWRIIKHLKFQWPLNMIRSAVNNQKNFYLLSYQKYPPVYAMCCGDQRMDWEKTGMVGIFCEVLLIVAGFAVHLSGFHELSEVPFLSLAFLMHHHSQEILLLGNTFHVSLIPSLRFSLLLTTRDSNKFYRHVVQLCWSYWWEAWYL